MTNVQIEKLKIVCSQVQHLRYTPNYKVTVFDVKEEKSGDLCIDFTIERKYLFKGTYDITHSYGRVFITPRGRIYYINDNHNKRGYKTIGQAFYRFD